MPALTGFYEVSAEQSLLEKEMIVKIVNWRVWISPLNWCYSVSCYCRDDINMI